MRTPPSPSSLLWSCLAACALAACSGGDGTTGDGSSAPPGPAWPGTALWLDLSGSGGCAVAGNGRAYCWGSNANHQLTWPHVAGAPCINGSQGQWPCVARAPVPLSGDVLFTRLSPAYQGDLCGVDAAGTAHCYSHLAAANTIVVYPAGSDGLTCNGFACSDNPLPVKGTTAFASFRWGANHACGLGKDGKAYCVFGNGQYGSLGSGGIAEIVYTPREVAGSHAFSSVEVATGGDHACALDATGAAWCWGKDQNGQLGVPIGSGANRLPQGIPYPVAVLGGKKFKQLTAALNSTCGIDQSGAAWCWGVNIGSPGQSAGLTQVPGNHSFASLAIGTDLACGVDTAGDGWCWGSNGYGELGSTTGIGTLYNPTPAKVGGGLKWQRIVPSYQFACGIATDGKVYCWGFNDVGQLGAPSLWNAAAALQGTSSASPVEIGK